MDSPKIPMTPGSGKIMRKQLNMKKFKEYFPEKEKFETFSYVLGISGGDCSGKK